MELKDKETVEWFDHANMEEILNKSVESDWDLKTFQTWCIFKIAQSLEDIKTSINLEELKKIAKSLENLDKKNSPRID